MGVPHAIGPAAHEFEQSPQGNGMMIGSDDVIASATHYLGGDAGRVGTTFLRPDPSDPLEQGLVVHAVAMHGPKFPQWLPRPIDNSSMWTQYNLYLSRHGEDPNVVRAALETRSRAHSCGFLLSAWPLVSSG